jgi:glycosyltransferase involved in cell wall biosynthesis
MSKFPVSLVIITLNEAKGIARAIESASFCSDIVVLDSGSTDDTCQIAQGLGARVSIEKWRGFRDQKQQATDLAIYDWVLSLDGDEALSVELQKEIKDVLTKLEIGKGQESFLFDGCRMPRLTWNLGRWIRHGGWYPDYQLRLYNRKRAKWVGGHVHEYVKAERVDTLKSPILHYPFFEHADQVATNNRYSGLGAEALHAKGEKFHLHKLLLKPVSKFVETYFLKRGIRDGIPGLIIAVGAAYSIFLKYAKLWELQNTKKK